MVQAGCALFGNLRFCYASIARIMQPLSSTVRARNLSELAEGRFDVLVIGGGVTGTGSPGRCGARLPGWAGREK